jgi:TonB family protein
MWGAALLLTTAGAQLSSTRATSSDLIEEAAGLDKQHLHQLIQRANSGDLHAQLVAATAYEYGLGVAQDYRAAARWLTSASSSGDTTAEVMLGRLLEAGLAGRADSSQAVGLYRLAAEQGNPEAEATLARCYQHGIGLVRDRAQAENLHRQAAAQGYAPSQCVLSFIDSGLSRAEGEIRPPKAIYTPDPEYSERGRKAKLNGKVMLRIEIRDDGTVGRACVIRPLALGLDDNALAAVRHWRFSPALQNDRPVPVQADVETNFRLY